jgi:hypothetical protein
MPLGSKILTNKYFNLLAPSSLLTGVAKKPVWLRVFASLSMRVTSPQIKDIKQVFNLLL